jgi:hypothetical protein
MDQAYQRPRVQHNFDARGFLRALLRLGVQDQAKAMKVIAPRDLNLDIGIVCHPSPPSPIWA